MTGEEVGGLLAAEAQIWEEYRKTHDPRLRERLILEHAPLVKYVAGRLAMALPSHIDLDDLVSYGIFGLIEAIDRYDHLRGVKFATYAIARIRGAIIDGLRQADWVPPAVRRKAKEIARAYAELERRLGRRATDEEMAGFLGISPEEFQNLLVEVAPATLLSLDDLWGEEEPGQRREIGSPASPADDPQMALEFEDRKRILAEAIDFLPGKERLVVALYYYEGLTVKEISQVMKLSPGRISQLHSKAILRLRGRLARYRESLL